MENLSSNSAAFFPRQNVLRSVAPTRIAAGARSTQSSALGSPEIKALTSLRGLAAMAVVLQHFSSTAQLHCSGWMPSLVPHGYMAVDFFFVLSGFIMSYTYAPLFQRDGMGAYLPFLWKRVSRIVPLGLALLGFIMGAALIASHWGRADLFVSLDAQHQDYGRAVLVNALHLQGFFPKFNLNGPSWSISVELCAYLGFPVLFAILLRASAWIAALVCAVGASTMVAAIMTLPDIELGDIYPAFSLLRCVVEFGFGMVVYRVSQSAKARRLGSDGATWAVSGLCLAAFLCRSDLAAMLSFPAVVLAYALNRGRPARLLSTRLPYVLGLISFSIYLVHNLFRAPELALLRLLVPAPMTPGAAMTFAALGAASVLPFAALTYYGIERPGRVALNRILTHLRRTSTPVRDVDQLALQPKVSTAQ